MKVNGETIGLKASIIGELETLYDYQLPKHCLWTEDLIETLSTISSGINREIAIYINRKGQIIDVSVGDNSTVGLGAVEGKRSNIRLSGITCIHTHPKGTGLLSTADTSSLKLLRLDAMISVGLLSGDNDMYVGILSSENLENVDIYGPYYPDKKDFEALLSHIIETDQKLRMRYSTNEKEYEQAILVGLQTRESRNLNGISEAEVSLIELEELAKTAGALVVGKLMQKRDTKNSATIVGHGKIEELRMLVQTTGADLVIFDEELTGSQQRNIESAVGVKVLSRTSLILDIFAQRARSREGKLQVELAQMEYMLPRLVGMGQALSRLGGGIGTRGPGETKLEADRRMIRKRITHLKEQLADVRRQRGVLRSERKKAGIPVVSLVGYTNAGKSTLLNTLCETNVLAEDKLFATLDTTTRKLILDNGKAILLTDTVGFIRKLPHNLLDAFKSTLEEVILSDLILIVADASDPNADDHIRIVDEILSELGAGEKPAIIVLNKVDRLTDADASNMLYPDRRSVGISAVRGYGLDELKEVIKNTLYKNRVNVELDIPFSDGATLAWLHANAKLLNISYGEQSSHVNIEIDDSLLKKVENYVTR